jgi:hypothetical protein
MPVQTLTDRNFKIVGQRNRALSVTIPGVVLVLFKMQGCSACIGFEPQFQQLSNSDGRIVCASIDITVYRDVIKMAQNTTTPIPHTPYLILYVNNNPLAVYKGRKDASSLSNFVTRALEKSRTPSQQFMPPRDQGNYQHQSQFQQGMYGKTGQGQHGIFTPEMDGGIPKRGTSQYAYINPHAEDDDDQRLSVPDIIPHNVPWEGTYKKYDG